MMKAAEELTIGDTLETRWRGVTSTIKSFEDYDGPIDFVLKIAVFTDRTKMSLEKGHYYNVI